jgi:alkyl hydroperoxide reductase subunit F
MMPDDSTDIVFDASFAVPALSTLQGVEPDRTYDVLVVGAGPAGLSASIYLIRKGLDIGIVAGNVGGQVAWTAGIENYLGYRVIEGAALVEKFNEQLARFPVGLSLDSSVTGFLRRGEVFEVQCGERSFTARALVLATGKRPRLLGVPGERRFIGRGVAYCATCDAPLYRGKVTAVVGGGNSGMEGAIDLARLSPRVYLIESGDRLSGDAALVERVKGLERVEILLGTRVAEILGEEKVRGLHIKGAGREEGEDLPVEGVFVEIGLDPNSDAMGGFVDLNERGEVEVDCRCATSVPGVFAAGDVTSVPYKQIVVAAGEGAKAALSAYEYLLKGKKREGE